MNCTIVKIKARKYLCLLIFMGACLFGCNSSAFNPDEGSQVVNPGDWDQSVQYYQSRLEEDPDNVDLKMKLTRARIEASNMHMARGESFLKENRFDEAIAELQLSIAFNPSGNKAGNIIEKARKQKEAEHLVTRGENFMKAQKYFQAREAFLKSLALDPSSKRALEAMELFKKKSPDLQGGEKQKEKFHIKDQPQKPVSFKFKKTSIINVFEVLSRLSGINFIFDKDVNDTKVTLFMTDVSYSDFIEALLDSNQLSGKMVDENTILIYPNNPSKVKEYEELKIRTFYLSHLEAKKAVGLLGKILKGRDVIANEKLNAVVVRGPEELLEIASRVIEANDRPSSEVLLNVEILEATRSKEKQLGIEVNPGSITFGVGKSAETIQSDSTFAGVASGFALGEISRKELMLSIPTAILHLLKKDGDTRTLANPQIRVRNNEKSNIHIGERVPLRSNRRVDTTGNVTYDFQYQDVGVKLEANPVINFHGEIVLDLTLEISVLGQNVGTPEDPEYSINTRKAKSVLTVRDGEPIIIGGLIRDEDRETIQKIPYLGEIPIVGRLFTSTSRGSEKTDILMSITPYVINQQEIPGENVTQIWSGKEEHFSISEPYESYQKSKEAFLSEPGVEIPSQPVMGEKDEQMPEVVQPDKDGSQTVLAEEPILTEEPVLKSDERGIPGKTTDENTEEKFFWPDSVPFSIHVNSYARKEQAESRAHKLESMNYECFVVYAKIPDKGAFYRVFVGKFFDLKSARAANDEYRKRKEFDSDIHVVDRNWAFKE